ncbi:MAG TPA: 50S ribosomal protein L18 [Blastocatellia bacterium]|nr:50S ribosomal protein L18 [Blastocatellia bacterium]
MAKKYRRDVRQAVHKRIRKKITGTGERPRLAIFRSVNHIYAQLIDDASGHTLAAASTTEPEFRGRTGGNVAAAKDVGRLIAERARDKGISRAVFDRGGYIYHGRVRNLAEAAREAGLEF